MRAALTMVADKYILLELTFDFCACADLRLCLSLWQQRTQCKQPRPFHCRYGPKSVLVFAQALTTGHLCIVTSVSYFMYLSAWQNSLSHARQL